MNQFFAIELKNKQAKLAANSFSAKHAKMK